MEKPGGTKAQCAICVSQFSEESDPRVLACGHSFCARCIFKRECALCRDTSQLRVPPVNHIVKKPRQETDFYCDKCLLPFDEAVNFPAALRDCGHTFCSSCLTLLAQAARPGELFCCPFDQVTCAEPGRPPFVKNFAFVDELAQRAAAEPARCAHGLRPEQLLYCMFDLAPVCPRCPAQAHQAHKLVGYLDFFRYAGHLNERRLAVLGALERNARGPGPHFAPAALRLDEARAALERQLPLLALPLRVAGLELTDELADELRRQGDRFRPADISAKVRQLTALSRKLAALQELKKVKAGREVDELRRFFRAAADGLDAICRTVAALRDQIDKKLFHLAQVSRRLNDEPAAGLEADLFRVQKPVIPASSFYSRLPKTDCAPAAHPNLRLFAEPPPLALGGVDQSFGDWSDRLSASVQDSYEDRDDRSPFDSSFHINSGPSSPDNSGWHPDRHRDLDLYDDRD